MRTNAALPASKVPMPCRMRPNRRRIKASLLRTLILAHHRKTIPSHARRRGRRAVPTRLPASAPQEYRTEKNRRAQNEAKRRSSCCCAGHGHDGNRPRAGARFGGERVQTASARRRAHTVQQTAIACGRRRAHGRWRARVAGGAACCPSHAKGEWVLMADTSTQGLCPVSTLP